MYFVCLVLWRMNDLKKKDVVYREVLKIHNTKLTLDDVYGKNLPPVPTDPDATIVGVDANKNNIRDDVELAIFKAYPDSAKTRAVLLQYALALQMEVTQKFVNTDTVIAVAEDGDRAYSCVGKIISKDNLDLYSKKSDELRKFVENIQLNNDVRKKAQEDFYKNLRSYSSPNTSCDIDLSNLEN